MKLLKAVARELAAGIEREKHHRRPRALYSMGFLTYRCTSRCRTCNIWQRNAAGQEDELSRAEWIVILNRLHDYGVGAFEVFGGDALLRDDVIFDALATCRDLGMESYFPTNSILCDRKTVRRLVQSGLGTIYLSLDDLGTDNDGVRGVDGAFDRVRETLETFIAVRGGNVTPRIVVCTTLSRLNFRNFPRLLEFLDRYPINAVYPRPLGEFSQTNINASAIDGLLPEPYFASSDGESHLLSLSDYKELRKIFSAAQKRPGGVYVNFRGHMLSSAATYTAGIYPVRPCHIATLLVTINPNGDVVPCPFFRAYAIGNLTRQPLERIWGNERHQSFLRRQQCGDLPLCRNCNMRIDYPSLHEQLTYYAKRGIEKCGLSMI